MDADQDQILRIEADPLLRVIRYRAPAGVCNACLKKSDCTDSDDGREVEHRLDLWLQTGLSHFHRGISLALIVLAAIILLVEVVRFVRPATRSLLCALLLATAVVGARSLASFGSAGTRFIEPK